MFSSGGLDHPAEVFFVATQGDSRLGGRWVLPNVDGGVIQPELNHNEPRPDIENVLFIPDACLLSGIATDARIDHGDVLACRGQRFLHARGIDLVDGAGARGGGRVAKHHDCRGQRRRSTGQTLGVDLHPQVALHGGDPQLAWAALIKVRIRNAAAARAAAIAHVMGRDDHRVGPRFAFIAGEGDGKFLPVVAVRRLQARGAVPQQGDAAVRQPAELRSM